MFQGHFSSTRATEVHWLVVCVPELSIDSAGRTAERQRTQNLAGGLTQFFGYLNIINELLRCALA